MKHNNKIGYDGLSREKHAVERTEFVGALGKKICKKY